MKPILFSGQMVRAILDGTKTQTRRVVKPGVKPPYYRGLKLWVRETWAEHPDGDGIIYRATDPGWDEEGGIKWRPSIFMFASYSRITLEVTDVRRQRLQEISEEDAKAEGTEYRRLGTYRDAFMGLWDSINAKRGYSWDSNPEVWAVTFKRLNHVSAPHLHAR